MSDPKIDYDVVFQCMVQSGFDKIIFTTVTKKGEGKGINIVCLAEFYRGKERVGHRELTENIAESELE